jgi:hypothetical protein
MASTNYVKSGVCSKQVITVIFAYLHYDFDMDSSDLLDEPFLF